MCIRSSYRLYRHVSPRSSFVLRCSQRCCRWPSSSLTAIEFKCFPLPAARISHDLYANLPEKVCTIYRNYVYVRACVCMCSRFPWSANATNINKMYALRAILSECVCVCVIVNRPPLRFLQYRCSRAASRENRIRSFVPRAMRYDSPASAAECPRWTRSPTTAA